ncbi:MAG: methyltransferase domain-containing protein [Peptococcaceae bacterium]|jgi:precorrin-6B methylase 2|nr:methyltransferase domain-containing protein [Peptococcaceae bacterium]
MNRGIWLNSRGIQDIQTLLRNYLKDVIQPGDVAVDATAGRGRDTLFLAQCVGDQGKVYAFDIQEEALTSTRELIKNHDLEKRVEIIKASHSEIATHVPPGIKAIVFNLGYLPGSSSKLATRAETTVPAIAQALNLLRATGLMAITVYRAHDHALEESEALLAFLTSLDKKEFSVLQGIYLNQKKLSPYWVIIQKNRRKTNESSPAEKNS